MIQCLCDEIKWGEWHRRYDVALSNYWPSDDSSGGSSASRPWLKPQEVKPTIRGHYCNSRTHQRETSSNSNIASPGNLLERHLEPHLRPTETESDFNQIPRWFKSNIKVSKAPKPGSRWCQCCLEPILWEPRVLTYKWAGGKNSNITTVRMWGQESQSITLSQHLAQDLGSWQYSRLVEIWGLGAGSILPLPLTSCVVLSKHLISLCFSLSSRIWTQLPHKNEGKIACYFW